MIKQKKKNRILLIFCTILVCLCSIISFIPFKQNDKIIVNADTVNISYDFEGSNILFPVCVFQKVNGSSRSQYVGLKYAYISFKFDVTSSSSTVSTTQSVYYLDHTFNEQNSIGGTPLVFSKDNRYHYGDISFGEVSIFENGVTNLYLPYIDYQVLCNSTQFNSNIVRVEIASFNSSPLSDFTRWDYYNYVKYIDENNNYIVFVIPIVVDATYDGYSYDKLSFDYRSYYLLSNYTDNDYYNQGFSAGKIDGYNNGYSDGQTNGYNDGYNVGQDIGYNNGYSDGLEESNQYSFLSLISATIDAPVKYFQSLFNFELLGVNLQGFLTGLFTLCVIITIFKLCLGGK